jgi:intracellular sulfur oxidation DsrE/DsrF family protein
MRPLYPALLPLLLTLLTGAPALAGDEIRSLLQSNETPAGVVFEVVESDDDALAWAIPRITKYTRRLRARFPGLGIAIVSHGKEQFALQRQYRDEYQEVHQGVQSLLGDQVQLHVCGTHAGWYGVTAEDFPDYVDVTAAGPAQINDYENLGWEVIVLVAPDD